MTRTRPSPGYISSRPDVTCLIGEAPSRVLDLGCSNGSLGLAVKLRFPATTVTGIDFDPDLAKDAALKLDRVIVADLDTETWVDAVSDSTFDLVICADVLEHLRDPWRVLHVVRRLLTREGHVIISIPNVRHWSVVYHLVLKGDWPLADAGVLDLTHLRFFTKRSAGRLVTRSGFRIDRIIGKWPFYGDAGTLRHHVGRILYHVPGLREFVTYQWILICSHLGGS